MATFPNAPRDLAVEAYLAGGWRDITPDVYRRDSIRITRGRSNEQSTTSSPSSCSFTLNNRSGKYSSRNPLGPYYGGFSRNTPLRVAIRVAKDAFNRTLATGWGTADVGGTWSTTGIGTLAPTDFSVTPGAARHTVTGTSTYRISYLATDRYRDVDVSCQVSLSAATVTGGAVEPANLVLSGLSVNDYLLARVAISATQAITVSVNDSTGALAGPVDTGFAYTGQALNVRFQRDGSNVRAKVWPASALEPYAWTVEFTDLPFVRTNNGIGWVGVRSGVALGNTNLPVTFSYSNFEVRSNRFAGEVSDWPASWDTSGQDVYTQIVASGILRRLGQGQKPLKSTYLRANQTIDPPNVAYWPVEDGSDSTQIASGLSTGLPMVLSDGASMFATDSSFPGSLPVASPNLARWTGSVSPVPASTGNVQVIFLLTVPSTGATDQGTILQLQTNGTAAFLDLVYVTGGSLKLVWYDRGRNQIAQSPTLLTALDGTHRQISVEYTNTGGDVSVRVAQLTPGDSGGTVFPFTITGLQIGAPTAVLVNSYRQIGMISVGHVAVRTDIISIYTNADELAAYRGETCSARLLRLGQENGVPIAVEGIGGTAPIPSAALGVQRPINLLDLMAEAGTADGGSLRESRSHTGLCYRTRATFYNPIPALELDYADGQLAPAFVAVEDDQNIRNDVTVTRLSGSSAQAIRTDGPLAVTEPSISGGGAGRYDTETTLNLAYDNQVADAASWLVTLGTVDEPRFPNLQLDLAHLAKKSRALDLAALAVDQDSLITIDNPKNILDQHQIRQIVRGYTETMNGFEHTITANCAPQSPYDVTQLDNTDLGRLDSDATALSSAITSAATSLQVDVGDGVLWTTDPAEMPIPVTVGGEDLLVTAVTGSSSPQTFTVTRAVNGVVKAHAAGEPLALTRPARVGR
ncbi:hypothetical protein [Amycolatopsis sp. NPDC001319]|uniref:hypothetical protein n=1 Tax=unclassified Amycolatopsis TaxID=2618356 RepID=UPI0036969EBA